MTKLKFYKYPDGSIVWIGSHNNTQSHTVLIDGDKVALGYGSVQVLPPFKSITKPQVRTTDTYYQNADGKRISKSVYQETLAQWSTLDGDYLSLEAEFEARKFQAQWEYVRETETVEEPVDFEIIQIDAPANEWMHPLRHEMGANISLFQLRRGAFAKALARQLCEESGLVFQDGKRGTYHWSNHSGLRFWQIDGHYVGKDSLEFKYKFIGTLDECQQELDRIRNEVTRIVRVWEGTNSKVSGAGQIYKDLEHIEKSVRGLDVYKSSRDKRRLVLQHIRELKETVASQLSTG